MVFIESSIRGFLGYLVLLDFLLAVMQAAQPLWFLNSKTGPCLYSSASTLYISLSSIIAGGFFYFISLTK